MTQEEMNILVPRKLREIEEQYNAEVLWAVESGSRAWGFASPDSDFDVRFIYKRKPADYLKLNPGRDVIELPVDETWDVNGWDLDKALKLLQKSNPTLFEWLNSPIVYCRTGFRERITPLMEECFSEEKMLYHYLNTARHNIKDFLQGDTVKPKKYFYAIRPILACIWVREYHSAPPVLFADLAEKVLPREQKPAVEKLLDLKINAPEKTEISPIVEINQVLDEKVAETDDYLSTVSGVHGSDWANLNRFFLRELGIE